MAEIGTAVPTQPRVVIAPTVGRMVYYKTRGSADGVYPSTNFAAIITEVCDGEASIAANENCVHLAVFGPQGLRFELHVAQGNGIGKWDWMPFQKDQVARMAPGTLNDSHGPRNTTTGSI